MKTNQFVTGVVLAFSIACAASNPALASSNAIWQQEQTIAEEASAIVTRLERGLGGLNNGQRDALRQGAESYARDRRASQQNGDAALMAAATAQFDAVAKSALSPAQYEQYASGRDFYLKGQGQRPAQAAGANTNATAAAGISNRFEQRFNGLNNGQRDAIRQGAESYVRDRETAKRTNDAKLLAAATAQFDNVVKSALAPAQYEQYASNRDFYLNGRGQRKR